MNGKAVVAWLRVFRARISAKAGVCSPKWCSPRPNPKPLRWWRVASVRTKPLSRLSVGASPS